MENQTNTSSGASIGRDVNTSGGDVIGRDQHNIQNIIIVGRFLEFAQAQNVLPKIDGQEVFENIRDAIEGIFDTDLNNDLAKATAFAGEILRDILADWVSLQNGVHISLRELILDLPFRLYEQLKLSGYWDMYSQVVNGDDINFNLISPQEVVRKGQILYLEATDTLFEEQLNIAFSGSCALLYINEYQIYFIMLKYRSDHKYAHPFSTEVERWSTRQQRLFLVGIVFDLIRIYSENGISIQFLKALINSLDGSYSERKNKKA